MTKHQEELGRQMQERLRRFCHDYLIHLSPHKAAITAGYSEKTASARAGEMMKMPFVINLLAELRKEIEDRTKVTQDRVVQELAKIGFSNMAKFVDFGAGGVTLKELSEMSEDDARCIAEVSETTSKDGGSIKFKLHDKKGALDSLGRHLGMFNDKVEHSGAISVTVQKFGNPDKPTE